jgi:hypothetical protein
VARRRSVAHLWPYPEPVRPAKKLAPSCEAFSAPGARAVRGLGPKNRSQETEMTSPYLIRPLIPLALALPRMLEKIEAELVTAGPAETRTSANASSCCAGCSRRVGHRSRREPAHTDLTEDIRRVFAAAEHCLRGRHDPAPAVRRGYARIWPEWLATSECAPLRQRCGSVPSQSR